MGKRGPAPGARRDQFRQLVAAGLTGAEIAREMGISRQRVSQIAVQEDVQLPRKPPAEKKPEVPKRRRRVFKRDKPSVIVPRLITGGVPVRVNTVAAGRVSELLVAADLVARGWHVFMPIDYRKGHDLVACGNGRLATFEVRSGRRGKAGGVVFLRNRVMLSQHYAVVVTGEPVTYEPPLEDLGPIDYRRRDQKSTDRDSSSAPDNEERP